MKSKTVFLGPSKQGTQENGPMESGQNEEQSVHLEKSKLQTQDTDKSPKLDSPSINNRIKSSQSAKNDFRINVTNKGNHGSISKTVDLTSSDHRPASKRSFIPSKLTAAYSLPIKEQEKEDNTDPNEAIDCQYEKTNTAERTFYKTPSEFPLSYKDNLMNLW